MALGKIYYIVFIDYPSLYTPVYVSIQLVCLPSLCANPSAKHLLQYDTSVLSCVYSSMSTVVLLLQCVATHPGVFTLVFHPNAISLSRVYPIR